jgi:HD superfamily phosphohydrolase
MTTNKPIETLPKTQTITTDKTPIITKPTLPTITEVKNEENMDSDIDDNMKPQKPKVECYLGYDKIWGLIKLEPLVKIIIDHPVFQRMKNIKQLGPLHFKFPYADHSRFDHSRGCAHIARYAALILQKKHTSITDREVLIIALAAGCHDLGHGAFSHSFDGLLYELKLDHPASHHEYRSQLLFEYIVNDLRSKGVKECDLTDAEVRLVQYFIDQERYQQHIDKDLSQLPKFYKGLEQLTNNQIHKLDLDKMDYLMRDASALRFDQTLNPHLDVLGLIKRSMIIDGVWTYNIKDQGVVYDLICRRFLFYTNRYLHPDVNAASCMLTDSLKIANGMMHFTNSAKLETKADVELFCKLTDDHMLELILNSTDERLSDARSLITRIITQKDWYKHMGDFVTSVSDLDDSSYTELSRSIFTDKSTPTNLLPKVRYHQNGVPIDPDKIQFVRRLYIKSPKTG